MPGHVYFVHVETQQNAVRRMTMELAAALEDEGGSSRLFSPADLGAIAADAAAGAVAAIVSLNVYSVLAPDLSDLARRHAIPVVFYNTDHPYLGYEGHLELMRAFPRLTITMTGEDEAQAARALHPATGDFPVLRQGTLRQDEAPWDRRDIAHLTVCNNPMAGRFGALLDPEHLRSQAHRIPTIGESGQTLLNRMIEIHLAAPLTPLVDVLDQALDGAPLALDARLRQVRLFDIYNRTRVRAQALTVLRRHPVIVCGTGWDFLKSTGNRAHFLGSVDTDSVLALTRRAKAIYNLVPHYYSCSERVLEGAMLGTPVVSTPSRFFQQEFGDALSYVEDAGALEAMLAHPVPENEARARALRARTIVLERHTWRHRARRLADMVRTLSMTETT